MFTNTKAFTLLETLISITLFATVASVSAVLINNVLKTSKKIQAQTFLYQETDAIIDRLASAVQNNALDYESYYLRNVGHQGSAETGWATTNYGDYQQTFMDPGTQSIPSSTDGVYKNVDGYGTACTSAGGTYPDDCSSSTPYADSLDLDTGKHPFPDKTSGDDDTYSNAFCEGLSSCTALSNYFTDELILINANGDLRTIFAKTATGSDYSISQIVMNGTDSDGDGAVDLWQCDSDYTCTGTDGGPTESEFKSITPSSISISGFRIYISPVEDPYRAFAETAEVTQMQPQVTIILTATLSDAFGDVLGDTPEVIRQRTFSTGIYSKIESYEE